MTIPLALDGGGRATAWMSKAACKHVDPETFFPAAGDEVGEAKAKAVCRSCEVHNECLSYVLARHIDHGVWGGASEEERSATSRAAAARGPERVTARSEGTGGRS